MVILNCIYFSEAMFSYFLKYTFPISYATTSVMQLLVYIDIGEIVDHHCLNFLYFVDIGEIVDHRCLNFLCFVDIGEIVDHRCLNFPCLFC